MKKLILILFVFLQAASVFAENNENGYSYIPLLNYEFVSVEGQKYHAPGAGLLLLHGDQSPKYSEVPDNFLIGILYKTAILDNPPLNYSNLYHDILFVFERRIKRHTIQVVLNSSSDEPVYGGLQTTQSHIGYGFEFLRKEKIDFTIGAFLLVRDYGIDLPNGGTWPVLPVPLVRFNFYSSIVHLSLNYFKFTLVAAPESQFRLAGSINLDSLNISDGHDTLFDCIFWYRFFKKDYKLGDFAGIGIGIKNSGPSGPDGLGARSFSLGEKNKIYDMNYYSVFGVLDVSFFKISGGYIFYSRERYDTNTMKETGKGFFVSTQVLYKF
ncbi:MAG: hypothetical protein LBT84_06445 [Spirochaetia bacterium]|nr:hypothetical protein [Spirochaetia bacterium]